MNQDLSFLYAILISNEKKAKKPKQLSDIASNFTRI